MKKFNSKGFSAVEAILILVIIVLIGVVGWLVYKNHHKTTTTVSVTTSKSNSTTTPTTSNPYTGWKTVSLQYEQINYKYPSDWTLSGSSMSPSQQDVTNNDGHIYYPGEDDFTLQSPSGNKVELVTGAGGAFIPFQTSGTGLAVQTLGSSYYINFGEYNSGEIPTNTLPAEACLGSTDSGTSSTTGEVSTITSKYVTEKDPTDSPPTSGSGADGFCYTPKQPETVSAYESDPDFTTAKLIFESLKY